MKRWISLILTAALCTSMCCIYAEDAVLGTSDEAQSIVLQEDSSQTTEVGSVSVPKDESEQEDLPADSSGQEISPEEPDPSSVESGFCDGRTFSARRRNSNAGTGFSRADRRRTGYRYDVG